MNTSRPTSTAFILGPVLVLALALDVIEVPSAAGSFASPSFASPTFASPTIVVMPFENSSGRIEYNWIGESFATGLAELLDKPGMVAIHSDERDVAYKQEGLPPTAILTKATMIKIAERAGASLLVIGTYRITGDGREAILTAAARVIDIREGRLVGREHTYGGPILELQRVQGELAYEILYQQNPALSFSRNALISQATRPPIGAFENYIKGKLTRDREARIDFLERAIKDHGEKAGGPYFSAIFELGRTLYEAGEHKRAVEELEKIEEKDPRYSEAVFYVGFGQDATGASDKALETLQRLAPLLPLYEVYNNIGVLLIKKKQYAEAVNHLKPAADAAPRDTDTLFNLGYAYHLAGDRTNAASTLKRALERRQSDGESHYILSKVLTAAGDSAGAAEASNHAKKLLAAYAQWETRGVPMIGRMKSSFSKANYYRYRRDQDVRAGRQAVSADHATEQEQLLEVARSAFFAGRDEDALSSLGRLLQVAPQNHEAHLLMGRLYERRGDFERATNALKAAVFWNPRLVPAHVLLGRIALLKNDCTAAESSLNKALQIDQTNQDAQALKRLVEQKCKS